MKKIYGFLGAFALLALASCTSDEPLVNNGGYQDDGRVAYINATISLPSNGSRSSTDAGTGEGDDQSNSNGSSDGGNEDVPRLEDPTYGSDVEEGHDYENTVRSMVLVITDAEDQYLTHLVITGMSNVNATTFETTARIPYSLLVDAYSEDGLFKGIADKTHPMHLYAFCNFTNNLLSQFNTYQAKVQGTELGKRDKALLTEWRDFHGSVEESASLAGQTPQSTASIWSRNSFMMSNVSVYESEFPKSIEEWDQYADDRNPLHLTSEKKPIKVERLAARLDFRDGSEKGDQTYPILYSNSEKSPYQVRLSRMVLVNMSKNFYYLRRVSDSGKNVNPEYAGKETPNNYVVDWDADIKAATTDGMDDAGINVTNADDYFNFPLFSENTTPEQIHYNNMYGTYGWYISNVSDILSKNNESDKWDGNKGEYKIWRYITENTLPAIDDQKTIQSTGIIFKAAIEAGPDASEPDKIDPEFSGVVSKTLIEALNAVKPDTDTDTEDISTVNDNEKPTMPDGTQLPAIYSFHSTLYAGVADIVRAARADGNGGSLYFAVDQILKNWYIKGNEKTFVYYAPDDKERPVAGDLLVGKDDEGNETAPAAVQLNVIIADEILNGNHPTDGTVDYAEEQNGERIYKIDFQNHDLDEKDSLAEFDNSRFIELAPAMNITVFIPTNDDSEGWGYYCYYFYWLRHNDNMLGGKMGPMEFAAVRNNVYKLAVTKINNIGRPRDTRRDPDPVKPGDPDEEPERSIVVEVDVLPWVVRVNDIEF